MKEISSRKMSIKKKVNIYYSSVIVIFVTILIVGMLTTANLQVDGIARENLTNAVQGAFDEIESTSTLIQISNNFDSYYKGVIIIVYSDKGELLKGTLPNDFPAQTPLESGSYNEISAEDDKWLVYDLFNPYPNGQGIYVRGIYAMDTGLEAMHAIVKIILMILPLLLFIAIFAGIRITETAFKPFEKVIEAAEEINEGSDLSKRLPLGKNIDEIYKLTETLNNMIERLDTAFRAEKEFTSDVAHELKTPLAVILSECEIILQDDREKEEYKEAIKIIQDRCMRTFSMIQQLLQLSRTINKESMLDKEEIDLSLIVSSVVEELSTLANDENVKLYSNIRDNVMIYGDETLLMRMIINVITNGIKYKDPAKESYVKVSLFENDDIIIRIEDNGIGMKEESKSKIFQKFYKEDKARNISDNSYGLGLAMVKWIVEAHNGTVTVESNLGKGSDFIIKFKKNQE